MYFLKSLYWRASADLADVLIIETVPLAITEGFDAGVVMAACSTARVDHDGEQLKGQQTLRINIWKTFFRLKKFVQ